MSVEMNAKMSVKSDVSFGTGSSIYAKVGSVSKDERVRVLWKEFRYYNIIYLVNSTGKYKSGYVKADDVIVDNPSAIRDCTDVITDNMKKLYTAEDTYWTFYRPVGVEGEEAGKLVKGDENRLVYTDGGTPPTWKYIEYYSDTLQKYKRAWVFK